MTAHANHATNGQEPRQRVTRRPFHSGCAPAALRDVGCAEPKTPPARLRALQPGDVVSIIRPADLLTVASVTQESIELVWLENGEMNRLFLPRPCLVIQKPRGKRPKLGDMVRLASGGPVMLLAKIGSPSRSVSDLVCCRWEEGGEKKNLWIDINLLEVVNDG